MTNFTEAKKDLAFIEILGKTVLLYEGRLDHTTIPEGFTAYDLRHEDEDWGSPCEVSPYIMVNFFGTIVSDTPIPDIGWTKETGKGSIWFKENEYVDTATYAEERFGDFDIEFSNKMYDDAVESYLNRTMTDTGTWNYPSDRVSFMWKGKNPREGYGKKVTIDATDN